ncbi:hypothetical protein FOA52_005695 [Chlamydomonas sp. UWO 241]|nr:hypothetical protein FOA52_005695 [Chlamydomonas sp. UWO 241]
MHIRRSSSIKVKADRTVYQARASLLTRAIHTHVLFPPDDTGASRSAAFVVMRGIRVWEATAAPLVPTHPT